MFDLCTSGLLAAPFGAYAHVSGYLSFDRARLTCHFACLTFFHLILAVIVLYLFLVDCLFTLHVSICGSIGRRTCALCGYMDFASFHDLHFRSSFIQFHSLIDFHKVCLVDANAGQCHCEHSFSRIRSGPVRCFPSVPFLIAVMRIAGGNRRLHLWCVHLARFSLLRV